MISTVFERYKTLEECDLLNWGGLGDIRQFLYPSSINGAAYNLIQPPHTHEGAEKEEKEKHDEKDMEPFDEKNDELKEFQISFEPTMEPITLKKPNEVYYNLYKQARKKAKEAKKTAVIAYLEAKNIKKTYMLENLDDSEDDDFDTEMEEFTENDMDDF